MSKPNNRTREDTVADRFWHKVDQRGKDQCWPWVGSIKANGEGQLWVGVHNVAAYRVSWELHYGEIPEGYCVLHKCDNRACVNPNHLFLGTKKANSIDMVEKGRQWKQPVTHCPQGHPYDEVNTHWYQNRRYCKACKAQHRERLKDPADLEIPNFLKSHCPQGHEYTDENTWKDSNGTRHCRTCNRERARARREAKRL